MKNSNYDTKTEPANFDFLQAYFFALFFAHKSRDGHFSCVYFTAPALFYRNKTAECLFCGEYLSSKKKGDEKCCSKK